MICMVVLAVPLASAGALLPIQEMCTPVGCTPRSCEPVMDCRLDVAPTVAQCAVNISISGRTCTTVLGVGASRPHEGTQAAANVELSDGRVDRHNLPNSWLSPSANVGASVAGTDLGSTSIGVYRSEILTEGPRGGPFGEVAPSMNHTWSEVSVFAYHEGPAGREGVRVVLWFLDMMPEGCFVRTQSGVLDAPCPAMAGYWNYVPALA